MLFYWSLVAEQKHFLCLRTSYGASSIAGFRETLNSKPWQTATCRSNIQGEWGAGRGCEEVSHELDELTGSQVVSHPQRDVHVGTGCHVILVARWVQSAAQPCDPSTPSAMDPTPYILYPTPLDPFSEGSCPWAYAHKHDAAPPCAGSAFCGGAQARLGLLLAARSPEEAVRKRTGMACSSARRACASKYRRPMLCYLTAARAGSRALGCAAQGPWAAAGWALFKPSLLSRPRVHCCLARGARAGTQALPPAATGARCSFTRLSSSST